MKRVKQYLLLFFILFLPQVLSAWGDGERASNGGCKFDKEMGFSGSTLYTKGDEAYIIVDMTDSRYGTTSTVYNAKTCEKVTSGNKVDSNFENLMEKRGFSLSTVSTNSSTLDQNFENKISFAENSDMVAVKLDTINNATKDELNQIISNISNKSASSQIYISQPLKELLSYASIYEKITNRINSLSDDKINYSYTVALIDKLKSLNIKINYSSNTLITRKENLEKRILAEQERLKKIRLAEQERLKKIRLAEQERLKKIRLVEQERLEAKFSDKVFTSSVQSIKGVPNWMNKSYDEIFDIKIKGSSSSNEFHNFTEEILPIMKGVSEISGNFKTINNKFQVRSKYPLTGSYRVKVKFTTTQVSGMKSNLLNGWLGTLASGIATVEKRVQYHTFYLNSKNSYNAIDTVKFKLVGVSANAIGINMRTDIRSYKITDASIVDVEQID